MTAARLKDILYYSAVDPSLPPPRPFFSLRGNGGRFEKSLGRSLRVRRSAEVDRRAEKTGVGRRSSCGSQETRG